EEDRGAHPFNSTGWNWCARFRGGTIVSARVVTTWERIMKSMTLGALALTAFGCAVLSVGSASAVSCFGDCGTLGADGVVTLSPFGSPQYSFISTNGGVTGAGQIAGVGGTNGSEFTTDTFSANAGDALQGFFNYVTSDGSVFADYAWAELQTSTGAHVAWLFTARTTPTGNTSPGFGLPALDAALTPSTSDIIPGGPVWSPLGSSSGTCFAGPGQGCGFTDWIQSNFTISSAGSFQLAFGVTNFLDTLFDSGLAFDGLTLTHQIPGVPVPGPIVGAGLPGLILACGVLLALARRRRQQTA